MSKRTKIVATVGTSTSSEEVLKAMIKEGVNVLGLIFLMVFIKIILI